MYELMAVAMQDAAVPEAGLISILLLALAPVLRTSLTSGLIYLANKATTLMAGWSNALKRLATVGVGVVVAWVGNVVFGLALPIEPMEWTTATAVGASEGIVATVIYWIGTLGKSKA